MQQGRVELFGKFPSWCGETDGTNLINVTTILSVIESMRGCTMSIRERGIQKTASWYLEDINVGTVSGLISSLGQCVGYKQGTGVLQSSHLYLVAMSTHACNSSIGGFIVKPATICPRSESGCSVGPQGKSGEVTVGPSATRIEDRKKTTI